MNHARPGISDIGPGATRKTWIAYIFLNRNRCNSAGLPTYAALAARILESVYRSRDQFTFDEIAKNLVAEPFGSFGDGPEYRARLRLAIASLVHAGVLRQEAGRGARTPDRWVVVYRPDEPEQRPDTAGEYAIEVGPPVGSRKLVSSSFDR